MSDFSFLTRRVRNKPLFLKADGSCSSALFKDERGVSVSKDMGRPIEKIIEAEEALNDYYNKMNNRENSDEWKLIRIVSISKELFDSVDALLIDTPEQQNPYHAIIRRNAEIVKLSGHQAKALAQGCEIIKEYLDER